MSITIDTATGDIYDDIGALIAASGQEDASGARRMVSLCLARREYDRAARLLQVTPERAEEIRAELVTKYGEPYPKEVSE